MSKEVSGLMNISGRSPNLSHNNSLILEWPKYPMKIWNRKYCSKKTPSSW